MIELTQLNGTRFILNCDLIETIENIPETKVTLTNGKFFLVRENREIIMRKVVTFKQLIFKHAAVGGGRRPGKTSQKQA